MKKILYGMFFCLQAISAADFTPSLDLKVSPLLPIVFLSAVTKGNGEDSVGFQGSKVLEENSNSKGELKRTEYRLEETGIFFSRDNEIYPNGKPKNKRQQLKDFGKPHSIKKYNGTCPNSDRDPRQRNKSKRKK